ncbi:hypothetical protein [Rheinheimera sp.]|uniref:hypothetical protein n=1 Tax=Rheinheimera sp. TaxID=1869214 RepID=UPI002FDDBC96
MKPKTTKAVKEPVAADQATETTDAINPDAGYTFLIDKGVASKLSPKSTGAVFFQLALKDEDNSLHLRISGNEGGGLHSKEWVSVTAIIELLKPLKDQHFKSNVFRKVMVGKSSNNVSFLSGILRSADIGLIQPSPEGTFLHELPADFELKCKTLLALAG